MTRESNQGRCWLLASARHVLTAIALAACSGSTAPAPPSIPAAMNAVAGSTPQSGPVGKTLPVPPAVVVTTAQGTAVSGITVDFAVSSGGGTLFLTSAVTDTTGTANAGGWTLDTIAGANGVTATLPDHPSIPSVAFTATGVPGPPVRFSVSPSAAVVIAGTTLQLNAAMVDRYGNAIASSPVNFASASPPVATISSSGLISGVALGTTTVTARTGSDSVTVPITVITAAHSPAGLPSFGVGISSTGVAFVTNFQNNVIGRFDLPATTTSASIAVGAQPADVTFQPDGSKAYVADNQSNDIKVIDVQTNTVIGTIPLSFEPLRVLASADGTTLYVSSGGGLSTVSTATSVVTGILGVVGQINGLALNPAQPLLYAASTGSTVYEINTNTNSETRSFFANGVVQDVAVSPDGSLLYVTAEGGALEIHSTATLALVASVPTAGSAFGLALTGDGAKMVLTHPSAGTYSIVDAASFEVLLTMHEGVPRRIAFDKSGKTTVISNESGVVTFLHWP